MTGLSSFNTELEPKRLELLIDIAPGIRRIAALYNIANPVFLARWKIDPHILYLPATSFQPLPEGIVFTGDQSGKLAAWALPLDRKTWKVSGDPYRLHQSVVNTLAARRVAKASLVQRQKLAVVIHLCGVKRGETFVTRGFQVTTGERCGTQSLRRYLNQVDLMKQRFARLRTATEL